MSEIEKLYQARDMFRFQERYSKAKIYSTYVLLFCIISIFLLEEYFGGSKDVFVLVSMGANVGDLVKLGEYYRLISSVFLHAGLLHVFCNSYVLYALGGFFNRIFGDAKYLCIFFVSGLTGSLASIFIGNSHVSVGASGAIWGLFGASISIAFFKNKLIPDILRARLRRITLINLVINLGVSFLPMVDMWAHLGGGVGGLLVSLLFLIPEKNKFDVMVRTYFFRVGALCLGFVYLSAIVFALNINKPWADQFEINLVAHDLEEVSFQIGIPQNLSPKKVEQELSQGKSYIFGELGRSRFAIEIQFFPATNLGLIKNQTNWLKEQQASMLANSNISAELKKTIHIKQNWDTQALSFNSPNKNNLEIFNYLFLKEKYLIKLIIISGGKKNQKNSDKLAHKIINSVQML